MASTAVFSPYVVFAGPPSKALAMVATPSPRTVRCNPGSFMKSLPHTVLLALMSPKCSINVTIARGTSIRIAETS